MSLALRLFAGALYLLIAFVGTGHALWRVPGSYQASIAWENGQAIMMSGDQFVLTDAELERARNFLLDAVIADPWPLQYRREVFKPTARMLTQGLPIDLVVADLLYKVSYRAGGNAVDLMTARYIYLRLTNRNQGEFERVKTLLSIRFPQALKELEDAAPPGV